MLLAEADEMRRRRRTQKCHPVCVTICLCLVAGNEPAPLASVESYNPAKQRWECVAPMPTARCSSALLQTPSMLFVIGGVSQGPSNAVEALCLSDTL